MLLVIIDIGIDVKKIATMHQKYVLPESTWSFLPFSDETAITAQSRAIVPARICIGNRICIISFPLVPYPTQIPYKQRVLEGLNLVCCEQVIFNLFPSIIINNLPCSNYTVCSSIPCFNLGYWFGDCSNTSRFFQGSIT